VAHRTPPGLRRVPRMSASVLIEAVESEGLGGGGVVAPAFGDVQVAGVFEGRDDGGADGGQVGGPAAGPAGGGVFTERRVPYVVMRLDGPVLADQAGQIGRSGVGAGQAGDGVDGLAGGPATPKPSWPAAWTATTPAPATKHTPSSAKPS
jgi:hypothetical protein